MNETSTTRTSEAKAEAAKAKAADVPALFAPPRWYAVPRAWAALVCGLALGFFDFWLLSQLGVQARLGAKDVTFWVSFYFAINFAGLAFLLGYASVARRRLHQQAEMLRAQYQALQQSQRHAAENEKLATIGRLAACVAHEVRNPLGVIRTSASMMMEDFPLEDDRWRAGEFICEEVIRLDAFCTALLNFSRPVALEKRVVQMASVISSVQRRMETTGETQPKAQIVTELSDDSLVAEVDQELLTQACLGLVDNALQAVGEQGRVALRVRRATPDRVLIEIADDGPGVEPSIIDKIFEPFFTTKATGTGLGLAMTSRIVEAHEGTLEVVSSCGAGPVGEGACFRMTLPIAVGASV